MHSAPPCACPCRAFFSQSPRPSSRVPRALRLETLSCQWRIQQEPVRVSSKNRTTITEIMQNQVLKSSSFPVHILNRIETPSSNRIHFLSSNRIHTLAMRLTMGCTCAMPENCQASNLSCLLSTALPPTPTPVSPHRIRHSLYTCSNVPCAMQFMTQHSGLSIRHSALNVDVTPDGRAVCTILSMICA